MKLLHGFAQIALHWTGQQTKDNLFDSTVGFTLPAPVNVLRVNSRIPLVWSSCACSLDNVSV